jgi:hypothetical protein
MIFQVGKAIFFWGSPLSGGGTGPIKSEKTSDFKGKGLRIAVREPLKGIKRPEKEKAS